MKVFKVNEYITLKLEKNQTVIYIDGERFNQCQYILLNRKIDELEDLLALESVDELAHNLDRSMEYERSFVEISPETEFWAHCSNLQIWVENDYDTRLLHSNLAFPLLKKLTEAGDKKALKVFKEEIAKRLESRYPSVVAYLVKENYIDYLPPEDVIDIIVDKELFKIVWNRGYELDFSNYLDNIGVKFSHVIQNKIIDLIQNQQFDNLIFAKEIGVLEGLKKEDLHYLIENPDIDLINKIFQTLKEKDKYDYYYQDGFYFSDKVMKFAHHEISERLTEIIKCNDENDVIDMIRLELLLSIDNDILLPLLYDTDLKLIERILDIRFNNKYDIFNFCDSLFNKFNEEISTPLREYLEILLINKNYESIKEFLENGLLGKLNRNDVNLLIGSSRSNFVKTIINISRDLNPKESYLLYRLPFTDKVLNYGAQSLQKEITKIIEKNNEYDIRAIIRLKLIQCLNDDDMNRLLHRPEINLLEYLLKVKKYEYEDVEEWIHDFFKKIGKYLSSPVKNLIIKFIEKDNLEELSFILNFKMMDYLNNIDKELLNNFLKKKKNYYQKKDKSTEREYYRRICENLLL
jgi:hypothetical protein